MKTHNNRVNIYLNKESAQKFSEIVTYLEDVGGRFNRQSKNQSATVVLLIDTFYRLFLEYETRINFSERLSQLEKNLSNYSSLNQRKILEQFSDATVVKSLESWTKMGYSIKSDAKPIEVISPVYESYDKHGNGIGQMEFVTDYVYDVSQMTENVQQKALSLKELSLFSSDELKELVNAAKLKDNPSEKERRELGTYRYSLKLSMLEEHQKKLLVQEKLLNQIQPLASDQPFVDFKKQSLVQELKAIELQLTPNFRLTEADITHKERLKSQFEDSVSFPISKASAGAIQLPIRQLRAELALVNHIQDESILSYLKGRPTTKKTYVDELQTQVSIFQLKYQIHNRNQKMSQTSDDLALKEMQLANAKGFSELKKLYEKLRPDEAQNSNQVAQVISKQLKERKQLRKASVQQTQGKAIFNTDFVRQISSALNSSQRASKKALMERARSDERAEIEEQRNER